MPDFVNKPGAFFAGAVFVFGGWALIGVEVWHAYCVQTHAGLQLVPVIIGLGASTFGAALITMGNAMKAIDVLRSTIPLLEQVIPGGRRKTDPPDEDVRIEDTEPKDESDNGIRN